MDENKKQQHSSQSLKIQLSLASLMFFSPLVVFMLRNSSFNIQESDRKFVKWYVSLGWINLSLLLLSLCTGIFSYFYEITALSVLYTIFVNLLIIILITWTIGAITETQILSWFSFESWYTTDSSVYDKKLIILNYIPLYNIYSWYKQHNFDNPDYILKESILFWMIFFLSYFLPIPGISLLILILILVRIVTLLANINIIPQSWSNIISWLFYKNPEEIFWYILTFFWIIFHGQFSWKAISSLIEKYKKEYSYLYDIKKFWTIQGQYFLLLVSIFVVLRQIDSWNISSLVIIPLLAIVCRYLILLFVWWRSPALPIFREITALFTSKKI